MKSRCDMSTDLRTLPLYTDVLPCEGLELSFKDLEDFLTHDRSNSCFSLHLSLTAALSTAKKRLIQFTSRNEFVYKLIYRELEMEQEPGSHQKQRQF